MKNFSRHRKTCWFFHKWEQVSGVLNENSPHLILERCMRCKHWQVTDSNRFYDEKRMYPPEAITLPAIDILESESV